MRFLGRAQEWDVIPFGKALRLEFYLLQKKVSEQQLERYLVLILKEVYLKKTSSQYKPLCGGFSASRRIVCQKYRLPCTRQFSSCHCQDIC